MNCSKLIGLCSFIFLSLFTFIEANRWYSGESSEEFIKHETNQEIHGTSCFSRRPEDNTTGPYIFTAPLCLNVVQYADLFYQHAKIIITNLPPRTNSYVLHYGDLSDTSLKSSRISVPINIRRLNSTVNKIWVLLKSEDSYDEGENKLILMHLSTMDNNGNLLPRPNECPPEPDIILNKSKHCLVYIAWNNSPILTTLDRVKTLKFKREAKKTKKPAKKKRKSKNNKKGKRKYKPRRKVPVNVIPALTTARPTTPDIKQPVVSTGQPTRLSDVVPYQPVQGSVQTLYCKSKEHTVVEWKQTYLDGISLFDIPIHTTGNRFNIIFTPELFDNGTYLDCIGNTVERYQITITPRPTNFNIQLLHYSNNTVNYDCKEYLEQGYDAKVMSIKNNRVSVLSFKTETEFTAKDNGTILSCLYFVYRQIPGERRSADITRIVINKKILIYDTLLAKIDENRPEQSQDVGKYYIGVAVVVGLIIICVIIFLIRKKIRHKGDMKSNDDANLMYAELDLGTPSCKRSNVEESPYAQIINPNVTYADLDMVNTSRRKPIVEDTPYAQIVDPNTVLYALPDMNKKTKKPRIEETPYAQITHK